MPLKDEPLAPDRDPPIELPDERDNEALDPNREPPVELPIEVDDEPPKCEPSIFDTARFGEIELREPLDPSMLLRPAVADDDDPAKFPACEFDATLGAFPPDRAFDPAFDPRDEPATELPAPALECVPAVFPVLGPRALPVFAAEVPADRPAELPEELPANECQLPSAVARFAPRPAVEPDDRAFNEFERPAFEPAPFRTFVEGPVERPPFIPFEREPPYIPPPPRYAPFGAPPRYPPPPYPRWAYPPPPRDAPLGPPPRLMLPPPPPP